MRSNGVQPIAPKDQRSPFYRWSGNALAGWIIVLFALVCAKTVYQNENWKTAFFQDAKKFGENCSVSVAPSTSLEWPTGTEFPQLSQLPATPHARGALKEFVSSSPEAPFYHAHYRCTVNLLDFEKRPGLTYAHLGWVFAERVRILVNGTERLAANDSDKFVLPLNSTDLAGSSLTIEIQASGSNLHKLGMSGVQQPALASGSTANIAIFGIDTALELTNNLSKLLPLLTLGLVLTLAWFSGMSTRVLLAGFHYFALSATGLFIWLMMAYLPFEFFRVAMIGLPLRFGGVFAAILVGMEVLGIGKRRIYPLMVLDFTLAVGAAVVFAVSPSIFPYSTPTVAAMNALFALASACLILVASRRGMFAKSHRMHSTNRAFGATLAFVAILALTDVTGYFLGQNWTFTPYVDMVLPLAIAMTILQYLQAAEERFHEVTRSKDELSATLAAMPAIKSLLHPAQRFVKAAAVTFEDSSPEMSDGTWLVHWQGSDGSFHMIQGKVEGDALKATVAAASIVGMVQSARRLSTNPASICETVHASVADLYTGYATSSAFFCSISADGKASMGAYGDNQAVRVEGAAPETISLKAGAALGTSSFHAAKLVVLQLSAGSALSLSSPNDSSDAASWTVRAA